MAFTQSETVVATKPIPPPRCWADNGPGTMTPHALECMQIADTGLGLCQKHYLEITGVEYDPETERK